MEHERSVSKPTAAPTVVGFLDLGTNSVRLLIVRVNPNLTYSILSRQKEVVRLGEGEFVDQTLHPEAMQRAAAVCRQLVELARSRQVEEMVAVATSATREAANQDEFVQLLKDEAGLDVHVVSGKEEARLIYLGVASGLNLGKKKALFIDIGGGSTETIVGDQYQYDYLETHKLGAIRLASLFLLPGETGPIDETRYEVIKNYARNATIRTVRQIKEHPVEMVIGSSGSITNLAEVTYRHFHQGDFERDSTVTLKELSEMIRILCRMPLEERREVPGINAHRADIIIPGAAILETLLEELDLRTLRTSERGLLEGMLVDYLAQHEASQDLQVLSIREKSVLQLGRKVNFEEPHAETVARLALDLFDSAAEAGLHNLDGHDRELLKFAALLHDTGSFIAYPNHQAHTYYLVHNVDLLGFDQAEIELIATIALFHRRTAPGKKHKEFTALSEKAQDRVRVLSMFLRLAESLDRSHSGIIQRARLEPDGQKSVCLELTAEQDPALEVAGANMHLDAFRKVFGKKLEIRQRQPA